jgi:hypothetical protein
MRETTDPTILGWEGQVFTKIMGTKTRLMIDLDLEFEPKKSPKAIWLIVPLENLDGTRLWPDYSVGFWIEEPALVAEMHRDSSCRPLVDKFDAVPVLFVPTASLMYLIASKE